MPSSHTMQGNTCPTEWYMSNGHSAKLRVCETSSDWLKIVFGYKVSQDTRCLLASDRLKLFHCAMFLLPLDLVSKNQLSTNQNLATYYDVRRGLFFMTFIENVCLQAVKQIRRVFGDKWFWWVPTTYEPHHEKPCFCPMRTTKVQISLRIRAVWSAPLLFAA